MINCVDISLDFCGRINW